MSDAKLRFGIVGCCLKHSFSPAMHAAAFAYHKIPATYQLFEKKPDELAGFLRTLEAQNIRGLNITIPYKEKVLDFVELGESSAHLRQVKAVNTILVREGKREGFNTDIPGFSRHIKEHIDPAGKIIALLGAGGAARAVAYALAAQKAKEIRIFDIAADKSRDVCSMIRELFSGFNIAAADSLEKLEIRSTDILVNATPIGMKESDPCLLRQEWVQKNLFVYDLVYNPGETKLLSLAKKAQAGYTNGLKMLLYQGMLSFEIWTGRPAPQQVMEQALKKELQRCLKH